MKRELIIFVAHPTKFTTCFICGWSIARIGILLGCMGILSVIICINLLIITRISILLGCMGILSVIICINLFVNTRISILLGCMVILYVIMCINLFIFICISIVSIRIVGSLRKYMN